MEDLKALLDRMRQQLEETEAQAKVLREEVETLERAAAIAEREKRRARVVQGATKPAPMSEAHTQAPAPPAPAAQRSSGRLIETIRAIVRELPEPFSTAGVREEIKNRDPELFDATHYSSISGTMRRMAKGGQLVPVEKGGPGKEATYRRLQPSEQLSLEPRSEDRADDTTTPEGAE